MNPGKYQHKCIIRKVLTDVSAFFNISKCCPFCTGIAVGFVKNAIYSLMKGLQAAYIALEYFSKRGQNTPK